MGTWKGCYLLLGSGTFGQENSIVPKIRNLVVSCTGLYIYQYNSYLICASSMREEKKRLRDLSVEFTFIKHSAFDIRLSSLFYR